MSASTAKVGFASRPGFASPAPTRIARHFVERLDEYWAQAELEWRRQMIQLCWSRIILHRGQRGRTKVEDALRRIQLVPRGGLDDDSPLLKDAEAEAA